jgi:hypothetical protein
MHLYYLYVTRKKNWKKAKEKNHIPLTKPKAYKIALITSFLSIKKIKAFSAISEM